MRENFESWGRLDEFMGYFLYDPSNRATQIWPFGMSVYLHSWLWPFIQPIVIVKRSYQRFSNLAGGSVDPALWLVWGQSYASVRKFTLYHCRMAMFVVLLLPGQSKYRQYFALLGTFGTLAAFVYPVSDAYPFPHITILSFIFGHLALLGNSLVYLLRQYNARLLDVKEFFSWPLH